MKKTAISILSFLFKRHLKSTVISILALGVGYMLYSSATNFWNTKVVEPYVELGAKPYRDTLTIERKVSDTLRNDLKISQNVVGEIQKTLKDLSEKRREDSVNYRNRSLGLQRAINHYRIESKAYKDTVLSQRKNAPCIEYKGFLFGKKPVYVPCPK